MSVNFGMWNEIEFLRRLGEWRPNLYRQHTRAALLLGYLRSCERRDDWGGLDREALIELARNYLRQEKKTPQGQLTERIL